KHTSLRATFWFSAPAVVAGGFVVARTPDGISEPRLGKYEGSHPVESAEMSVAETRGLRFAFWGLIGVLVVITLLVAPPGSPLRNPETGEIVGNSPFMNSLIVSIALVFLAVGAAYGIGAGTVKTANDIVNAMIKAISSLGGRLFLLLVIAQFLAYFNYTNMTTLAA